MLVEVRHRFQENANQRYHQAQLKQSGEMSAVEFLILLQEFLPAEVFLFLKTVDRFHRFFIHYLGL